VVTADYAAGTISVFPGAGSGAFGPPRVYQAGAQPGALTLADVNADGFADVILTNESARSISIFPGNGDGALGTRQIISLGFNPSLVAVGDFTGTGKTDLAVTGTSGTTLSILQNDGSGHYGRPINTALSSNPTAVTAGDFNRDGHLDLAIANADGSVSILLGSGNGQFSVLPSVAPAIGALSAITIGDFNRDGIDDIAVTSSQNKVAVLVGQGNGRFSVHGSYPVGGAPVSVRIADVDGDGVPDLVVLNQGSNTFSVLSGAGDGSFHPAAHYVVGNAPLGLAIGDFYSSGNADVATINSLSKTLSLPSNNGDATFLASRAYIAGTQPVSVAAGDLRGTGRSDLVVANYCATDSTCGGTGSAAVLLSDAAGVYQLSSTYVMGSGSVSVALVDVNGDGKLDLVALNRVDKTLSLRLGAGDGTFSSLNTIPLPAAPIAFTTADFNGDHIPDLVVVGDCGTAHCTVPGSAHVLLGAADGNFRLASSYTVGYNPVSVAAGSTRAGAPADFVVANRCGQDASCTAGATASLLLGNGTGAFSAMPDLAFDKAPSSIALANLRGTGVLDLVVARSGDNSVAVLPGKGDGTFAAPVSYAVGATPGALAIADFNGDGIPDVAVANTGDATVSVLYGSSTGALKSAATVAVGGSPLGLAAIPASSGARPGLATTSGSTTAAVSNASVTVVANFRPRAAGVTPPGSNVLASSPTSSSVNQSVALTATVTGGSGTPTGNVVFLNGATALADCGGATGTALDLTGKASCSTSSLPAGSLSLSANYLGDATYAALTSNTVTQTVAALSVNVGVTATPASPQTVNTSVTFKATLSGATFTPTVPSGTVTFSLNGTPIASCINVALTGVAASCLISDMPVGASNSISAAYAGDPNFTAAAPGTASYVINAAVPVITVTPAPASPQNLNASVTFTAALTGVTLTPITPGGTMTFALDGTTVAACTHTVSAGGTATCPIQNMTAGVHNVTATYTGDSSFVPAAPGSSNFTVSALAATVGVSPAPASPSNLNTNVTFTASLSASSLTPVVPSGKMAFAVDGTTVASCSANSVTSAGVATCAIQNMQVGSHTVTATYSGDANYTAGAPGSSAYVINALHPSFAIAASPGPTVSVGTPVTFTSTLSGVAFTPVVPNGTVAWTLNGTPVTGCTAVAITPSQTAPCTMSNLVVPADTITATYSGDTNFIVAAAANFTESVTQTSQTVTLSSSQTTTTVNHSVTLTAVVPAPGGQTGKPFPTGNVTFVTGTTTLCGGPQVLSTPTLPLSPTNQPAATCTTSFATATGFPITATYSGDANFQAGTPGNLTETVNAGPTTTTLAASGSAPVNQPVTFTATVKPNDTGTAIPQGTVTFVAAGATPTGTCTAGVTLSGGIAPACTFIFASAGTFNVTATFTPSDSNFSTSASSALPVGIGAGAVTINLSSGTNPSAVNQAVTFTASFGTITGTKPNGTMTFTDTLTSTTLCAQPVVNGAVTTCSSSFATAGAHTVEATFASSDANFGNGTSNVVTQTVNQTGISTTVVSGTPTASVNQVVTFTSTVAPSTGGTTHPTGNITFTATSLAAGSQPIVLCTNPVSTTGSTTTAICTVPLPAAGTFNVTAAYAGDKNFAQNTSAPISQVVNLTNVSTTLVSGAASPFVNQAITFTATLAPAITGPSNPTGTVLFTATNTTAGGTPVPLCTSNAGTTAAVTTATCTAPLSAAASYTVTAAYNGDGNFNTSTSTPLPQAVVKAATTVSLSPPSAAAVNLPATYSVTIMPATAGATVPSGTVTFTDTVAGTLLCSPQILAGTSAGNATASCAVTFLTAATHTITATYSGDTNFTAGAPAAASITIGRSATTLAITPTRLSIPATAPITFAAVVSPTNAAASGSNPTGTVDFSSTDLTLNACRGLQVIKQADGTFAAICQLVNGFPHNTALPGQVGISASYNGDGNFVASTATLTETVQDFNIAFAIAASPVKSPGYPSKSGDNGVYLTQGYTNTTDLFNPATMVVTVTTTGAYAGPLNLTCAMKNASGSPVSDPSCTVAPGSQAVSTGSQYTITVNASAGAPVGKYSITLSATDNAVASLTQPAGPKTVYVVAKNAALTLASGATGAENVQFNTSTATGTPTLTTYSCPQLWNTATNAVFDNIASPLIVCTGPGGTAVTGAATSAVVNITASSQTTALLARGSTLQLAGIFGLPVLVLLGWFGSRNSRRRNLFRLMLLILVAAGFTYVSGCGGSSVTVQKPATAPGTAPGSYLVQVTAKDSTGNLYYTTVPLTITNTQ
jgi:hypothetical protein